MKVRTNGVSVKDFAPHIFTDRATDLYSPGDEPLYKPQVSNGYFPYDFLTNGLVLYLPLPLLKGSTFKSVDPYRHTCSVTGALWGPNGREFDGDDYIEIPASSTQLNFTSEDFSIIARIKVGALTTANAIFFRGQREVDGYEFFNDADGSLWFTTNQLGAFQYAYAAVGSIVIDTWYTVGVSRDGEVATVYKNGVDVTAGRTTLIDPATSTQPARIGVRSQDLLYAFDGKIQTILIYNRALSAGEHLHTHNILKGRE